MKYKEDDQNLTHVILAQQGVINVFGYRGQTHYFEGNKTLLRNTTQTYVSIRTMTPSTEEDGVELRAESTFINLKLEQVDELILALSDHRERMKLREVPSGTSQTAG